MSEHPVLVLSNRPILPPEHPEAGSEHDIRDTVHDTVLVLAANGYDVRRLSIAHDPQPLLDELREHPPLAVFNLFEGLPTQPSTEVSVAALLEWLNVSFTGCPPPTLALGRDKIRVKHLLAAGGLPTPPYRIVESLPAPEWHAGWPAIVKPALQDASVGIHQNSVVTNQEELATRVEAVFKEYGPPVLIEQFIPGREFLVHVFEEEVGATPTVLPPSEIAYVADGSGRWPLYTYTAKWDEASDEFKAAEVVAPVELPPELMTPLADIAARGFGLLGCRDYARLDVRLDAMGQFHILEVNPNPYLNSIALVRGAEAIGQSHEWFIVRMMENAIDRGGRRPVESETETESGSRESGVSELGEPETTTKLEPLTPND